MKIVFAKAGLFITLVLLQFASFAQTSPKYEFRAVWVATVENIDWPSRKGLSTEEQKAEFIRLLDMNKRNGMNAIIMQIRPVADAFYPSPFEPWSEYLTGKQGVAPNPYYDPLKFMIEETHKRGMEFHAWLNPYRAVFNIYKSSVAPNHITRTHPEWFLNYGDKKYFDPGQPEAMEFVAKVVKDIVSRYDLDGIHMDDYFYPYRIPGKDFPDNKTYLKYGDGLTKDDWRRSNCDSIIKLIHDVIIDTKPMVKFGISPFGVWRNKSKDPMGSDTRAGVTNYDDLYADILLWLKEGWIDYVAPQLYWEIGHPLCDYETLLNW
ncbi:MAG: glycoside hydrolase family 10 protein, partial [Ilyomonas sp.]